jgi:hypothetical protein
MVDEQRRPSQLVVEEPMQRIYSERFDVHYERPNSGAVLSVGNDAKTVKSLDIGYLEGVIYHAPSTFASAWVRENGGTLPEGLIDLCSGESVPACIVSCLWKAGHGKFDSTQLSRIMRSLFYLSHPEEYYAQVEADLGKLVKRARKRGLVPLFRPSGTSGHAPHRARCFELSRQWEDLKAFDYSGSYEEAVRYLGSHTPVTLSLKGPAWVSRCKRFLDMGGNVAVSYIGNRRDEWEGYETLNGDAHDVRLPLVDGHGKVVALSIKHTTGDRLGLQREFFLDWR